MGEFEVSDEEVSLVIPILQRLVFSDKENREKLQKMSVNVLPCDFYSSTPSIEEIENSFEYASEEPPYFNPQIFDKKRFQKTLESLIEFSKEFNPPKDGDEENCQKFFWKNTQFSSCDAMAYYCFIRQIQPSNIVEIGSGFSTLVALEAIEMNGAGSVHCVEPFPRNFLKNNKRVNLNCVKVQELEVEFFNDILQDGDILFIDSTHTVKSGSDCLHIYLRLLPEIRKNIYVHVHDVFLPYGMPEKWLAEQQIFWTEQYLLLAFLIDNPKASLLYASNFNANNYYWLIKKFMNRKSTPGGSSVWFSYNGNTKSPTLGKIAKALLGFKKFFLLD